MEVVEARAADLEAWVALAAEVEELFGAPMSTDPAFLEFLGRNIARGTAFCVRAEDGSLLGAATWSPRRRRIGWLAVHERARRRGVGALLVARVLEAAGPGALSVVTFGADGEAGRAARALYERFGFRPAGADPESPPEWSREIFVREG